MNNSLKYKLDTAGIVGFVVSVLMIIGVCRLMYSPNLGTDTSKYIAVDSIVCICATLFGPISGVMTGFLGAICASAVCTQTIAIDEALAFATIGIIVGQFAKFYAIREGQFTKGKWIAWNLAHVMALIGALVFMEPFVDYILYDKNLFSALEAGMKVFLICAIPEGILLTVFFIVVNKTIYSNT